MLVPCLTHSDSFQPQTLVSDTQRAHGCHGWGAGKVHKSPDASVSFSTWISAGLVGCRYKPLLHIVETAVLALQSITAILVSSQKCLKKKKNNCWAVTGSFYNYTLILHKIIVVNSFVSINQLF